jgi:hypothetical protein
MAQMAARDAHEKRTRFGDAPAASIAGDVGSPGTDIFKVLDK